MHQEGFGSEEIVDERRKTIRMHLASPDEVLVASCSTTTILGDGEEIVTLLATIEPNMNSANTNLNII